MSMKRIAAGRGPYAGGLGVKLGGGLLVAALTSAAGFAAGADGSAPPLAPPLAPHRAVYDLALADGAGSRSVTGASGRIAYEVTGDACSGYSLDFRQLVILDRPEGEPDRIEIRATSHEDANGAGFRYRQGTIRGGGAEQLVQGVARHEGKGADAGISVKLTKPERRNFSASGEIVFPSSHLQRIIAAAKAGESTLGLKLYDAAEDGSRVFDTFAVIGKRAVATPERKIEDAARKAGLDKVDRWPVTVSYYEPGAGERTPAYSMAYDLYENGLSGAILMNYGAFAIRGELRSLAKTGEGACPTTGKRG